MSTTRQTPVSAASRRSLPWCDDSLKPNLKTAALAAQDERAGARQGSDELM